MEEKFQNEFLLKAEQQALQQVLAKHQQQRQKSQMKGGSSFASKYQAGPSVEEKCPTAKEGFGNIFYYDEGLENGTVTVISILLGKPFDVSTDFCLQYQFRSESIINNEKLELEKELVRMLKLEDHSDHKNWETLEANGCGNGCELRSEHVESNRNEPAGISDLLLSLVSGMEEKLRAMVTELYHAQKEFMSQPLQYIFWVLEYGGKDTLIYNLDVSLISDFFDSLTPENMIVASLGLADTEEDDLFGDLQVFELYAVNHTVSELKKKIKVNVKLTLPSELK